MGRANRPNSLNYMSRQYLLVENTIIDYMKKGCIDNYHLKPDSHRALSKPTSTLVLEVEGTDDAKLDFFERVIKAQFVVRKKSKLF